MSVTFRISKASSKLLKLTFGRFIFYKAVYALTKEGELNLFRYHFTTKLYVLLYIFSFYLLFLQQRCPKKCRAEGIVTNYSVCGKLSLLSCFCQHNQVAPLCKQLI